LFRKIEFWVLGFKNSKLGFRVYDLKIQLFSEEWVHHLKKGGGNPFGSTDYNTD